MALKNRDKFPPGGWQFFQPQTNWRIVKPLGFTFKQAAKAIIEHRLGNPTFGFKTDFDAVCDELDAYTCARLNYDPAYCTKAPIPKVISDLKKNTQPQRPGAGLAGTVKRLASGGRILREWLGEGGQPVDNALANSRAGVCETCAFNDPGNWMDKITGQIARAIHEHIRFKNQLDLRVLNEDKIATCRACRCHLPLKVWVPMKHVHDSTPKEVMKRFPPHCWMLTEES